MVMCPILFPLTSARFVSLLNVLKQQLYNENPLQFRLSVSTNCLSSLALYNRSINQSHGEQIKLPHVFLLLPVGCLEFTVYYICDIMCAVIHL